MKALMISADEFDDLELFVPYYRLQEDGIEVHVASMKEGIIHGKHGNKAKVDKKLTDVNPEEYDILVLPGGRAPETLRKEERILEVVRQFFASRKPVAAICHGPQILISAGLMKGRRATCYKSVIDEMIAAGAHYEYRDVVVDGNLITARQPSDLPAFIREMMHMLRSTEAGERKAA